MGISQKSESEFALAAILIDFRIKAQLLWKDEILKCLDSKHRRGEETISCASHADT